MSTSAEFSMVNSFGLLVMAVPPPRSASAYQRVSFARAELASAAGQREGASRRRASAPDRVRPARLGRPDGGRVAGQDAVELAARADVELGEDLAQVVLDRARTDEQPGADLGVGESVAGEPRDLPLLSRELVVRFHRAFADSLARGPQLAAGSLGERLDAHRVQHV